MASARNKVIAGDYEGHSITRKFLNRYIVVAKVKVPSETGFSMVYTDLDLSKCNIESYEIITEEKVKSGSSAIMRGALGAAVLGPVGLLAGLTAKNKEIHTIAIEWKNGKKSLIEIDDDYYKQLIKDLF